MGSVEAGGKEGEVWEEGGERSGEVSGERGEGSMRYFHHRFLDASLVL